MKRSSLVDIRGNKKTARLGKCLAWLIQLWSFTLRYQIKDLSGVTSAGSIQKPMIFALWHNRIFSLPAIWFKSLGDKRKTRILTSASKDGNILENLAAHFGAEAIRGSSSRRSISAWIGMRRSIQEGYHIMITPDGPKGPRYQVQAGVIKLAQHCDTAIIPIHLTFSCAWRLNTWDQFVIPLPFSKVTISFDRAISIPQNLDEAEEKQYHELLQKTLLEGTDDA